MLTILDLLNHYLGFFNVNARWKGQVYTVLASVGNFYILYLAVRHIQNGAYLRGALLALAFLLILYGAILNIVYYYTKKTIKWDVSPKLEKMLGGPQAAKTATDNKAMPYVPANGLYDKKQVLPATAISDNDMAAELTKVVDQLREGGLITENYGGLSEKEQLAFLATGQPTIFANHPGTPLPYFKLEEERGGLAVYGGMNEMLSSRLARIQTVGLQPVDLALKSYNLYIASVVVTGGPGKTRGRHAVMPVEKPYKLAVELAYTKK